MAKIKRKQTNTIARAEKFGQLLLETECEKKGMSLLKNWTERYLRLFDVCIVEYLCAVVPPPHTHHHDHFTCTAQTDNGLVLAYYKNKDSPKHQGYLRIKPHGKVHEVDYAGKSKGRRQNVLTIAALCGRDFTCSMPDPDTRARWASLLREEADNAVDEKGRRLSQVTDKMTKENIARLTIKIVSHMRYKKGGAKIARKQSARALVKEHPFGFDFGAYNFSTGKWYKLWTKTMTGKQWQQAHEKIRKSGLLNVFGESSASILKFPESYANKKDPPEQHLEMRALDMELCFHSIFNHIDINAIKANAAPWATSICYPQLHEALQMPSAVAARLCQLGYQRKCLAFGEDPTPEVHNTPEDFDLDEDDDEFNLRPVAPAAPERAEVAKGVAGIRRAVSNNGGGKLPRQSKVSYKPVVIYTGILWKKPTSGGLGRGRKRWFTLRRTEGGRTAMLEYFEDSSEKSLKGKMVLNESCELLLGTAYCFAGRWRFCIKAGSKLCEAEAGSEKEFGTWAMHILRYTYSQNCLSCVTPKSPFEESGSQLVPSSGASAPAAAAAASIPSSSMPPRTPGHAKPRETPTHQQPSESKTEGAAPASR